MTDTEKETRKATLLQLRQFRDESKGPVGELLHRTIRQIQFRLVAADISRDHESWNWFVVIECDSKLLEHEKDNPNMVSEEQMQQIYKFVGDCGIMVRSEGGSGAGRPFADAPWIQWFPNHIIVSQSGGLDV